MHENMADLGVDRSKVKQIVDIGCATGAPLSCYCVTHGYVHCELCCYSSKAKSRVFDASAWLQGISDKCKVVHGIRDKTMTSRR